METGQALAALSALAQETRLALYRRLVEAGRTGLHAGALGEALGVAPATLSFHLKELAAAGLVQGHSEGRFVRYLARFETMNELIGYLTRNCCRDERGACAPAPGFAAPCSPILPEPR